MFLWKRTKFLFLILQNQLLMLVLLFLLSTTLYSQKIIDPVNIRILRFSLYNYDNIIADYYESSDHYIGQLTYLIHKGTGIPQDQIFNIIFDDISFDETNPVNFMININRRLKTQTGYYFIDD